ncbi:DNA topoisomerase 2-binding protein 1 isoform X2 [Diachasma alloeum]|uniref:DNA topoisomerase 2-binding protein 1 isoform X2 n=1 Tax=Diachasma alloeum TaxID=454923 RepID=UPI00073850A7|nr:DNA topoisomerase 2-binding protein 1 isoform X2 [Diachasma alloeum]
MTSEKKRMPVCKETYINKKTMTSHFEGSLNVYFLISNQYASEDDCSEDMWEAFQKCKENEIPPQWIKENECQRLKPEKTDIFVLEKFQGDVFKKLQGTKCLILGPKCLLRCFLTNEPIPPGTSPVLNTAMRDVVACFSGFSPEDKLVYQQKIEYMGGICIKELRHCVTHLIGDSVMSAKYEKAMEDGIKVYTKDWIFAVWETNLKDYIPATDGSFDKYQVPVFMNLVVTSTNIPKDEKDELKKIIEQNGGKFMGPLDGQKVKILIAKEYTTMSDKIRFAMANSIPCLKPDWVKKSIEVGYALPFNEFLISPSHKNKCSTPEKGSQLSQTNFNISTISCIQGDLNPNALINETMSSTLNATAHLSVPNRSLQVSTVSGNHISITEAKKAGPFLDGCNIYLAGFSSIQRDKINKIINMGSATRYDEISETLTHVIVGDPGKAFGDLKIIQAKSLHPHILNIQWLEESIKLKKPAPEESFAYVRKEEPNRVELPSSPLSKKNLQMLQKSKRPLVPVFQMDNVPEPPEHEPDLIEQYLQRQNSDRSMSNFPPEKSDPNPSKSVSQSAANDSEMPFSQPSTMGAQIFQKLTFFVTSLTEEEDGSLRENISGLGGKLVSRSFTGITDFAIVPFNGVSLKTTANQVVTSLFVDDCLDHDAVVDIQYYHLPICIPESVKPLADCVIVVSAYTGIERTYLSKLAAALGARHQDMFARKTNIEKGLYGGTHLICTSPEGNKYNAAVKWKRPAVTAEWLRACAEKLTLVDETPFLVGETMAPERKNLLEGGVVPAPLSLPNRQILTPKRLLNQTPNMETPIINKRLSLNKNNSANSPFHFATPETPYGQVFQASPSPNTKKAWAKWIDGLPENVEEQQPKKRKLSTPLSELKRQLWSALKKPKNSGDEHSEHSDSFQHTNEQDSLEQQNEHGGMTNEEQHGEQIVPINRELSFDDDTPKKTEIHQELEEMDKMLKATSSSSNEGRFSIHGEEREKISENCNVPATQAESVGWEDPHPQTLKIAMRNEKSTLEETEEIEKAQEAQEPLETVKKFKFMLSGIKDREYHEALIRKLGGEVSTQSVFDDSATHLLCIRPSRNEKMLGSIAGGKWVLHSSYLRDCETAGRFIDEESYEWGNALNKDNVPSIDVESEKTIAAAAHRWRMTLKNSRKGAFEGIVAMLMVNKDKYDQFERLIKAGGGTVVQAKPPYDSSPSEKKITHCFIANRTGQPMDWAMLASKGIMCFPPQFLNTLLTTNGPLNPRDHVIPEFKKYLALLPK